MVALLTPTTDLPEPLDPIDALRRVAFLLERTRAGTYRVEAFRNAVKALKTMAPGDLLEFIADDPAFTLDVQAWARRLGYPLSLTTPSGPEIRGTVCRA